MKTYVALDLETTGFDPLNDQVIEIAAVKFEGDKIIGTFDSLVNPRVPIPPIITHITGIKAEDLTDAPDFAQIKGNLVEFIGSSPIVGHNIPFDVSFLNQKGMALTNKLYDTLQLAGILLPGLSSYSLDTLTRILKINHENKHRALSDTKACFELFLMLEKKLAEIDAATHEDIIKVLGKSTWSLKELFEVPVEHGKSPRKKIHAAPKQNSPTEAAKFSEANFLNFFEENGPLSKGIKDYEARPMQKQMAEKIVAAFKNSTNAIIEAGTGTGKTMAYLLAALYYGLNHNEKITVSTYTKNLQEQIIKKDVPLFKKICHSLQPRIDFSTVVLKGRRNYLSGKRLRNFLEKDFFMDHEVSFLIKVLLWVSRTESGDMEELSLQNKEFTVLDDICCAEYVCPHEDSEYKEACYLMKARKKAENANLVIVNHALLLQNAVAETPLLPENERIIIDEAHHLEKVATETLTISISFGAFVRPFEKLLKVSEEVIHSKKKLSFGDNSFHQLKELKIKINQLVSKIDIFFGLMGIFMEKSMDPMRFQYQLNLKRQHYESQDWQKVSDTARGIVETGFEFLAAFTTFNEDLGRNSEDSLKEMKNHIYECERRLNDLKKVLAEEKGNNSVSWIFKTYEGSVSLKCAPADSGQKLQDLLYGKKKSVILTSATLRTDHSFTFMREQLGLNESFEELALPSHFAYPDQVKIIIPEDLPEPATEGYFLSCAELIEAIIKKNKGRVMVLFTSKKALSATYHQIAPALKEAGFTVLAQNITGGRGKILEHFKDEPGSTAIFGTASFWEGVDIKGSDLTCVVLQKLPFDPPEDPIILARSRKYSDSFNQFQLPRAILKFKQGFGRLIRSSTDTGSIVILDTRIIQKSYGQKFLQSLPEGIKIEYGPKSRVPELL